MTYVMASKSLTDAYLTAVEELSDYLWTLQRQITEAAEYDQIEEYIFTSMDKKEEITTPAEQVTFYESESHLASFIAGGTTRPLYSSSHSKYDRAWRIIEKLAKEALATLKYSLNEGFSEFTEDSKARLRHVRDKLDGVRVHMYTVFD